MKLCAAWVFNCGGISASNLPIKSESKNCRLTYFILFQRIL